MGGVGLSAFGWKALVSTAYTAGLASFVGYGAWNSLLARYPSSQVVTSPWKKLDGCDSYPRPRSQFSHQPTTG